MSTVRVAAALAVMLTLLAPVAVAAEAEGALVVEGPIELAAPARTTAPAGDLLFEAAPALDLQGQEVEVFEFIERTMQGTLLGGVVANEETRERSAYGAARIRLEDGAGAARVALSTSSPLEVDTSGATLRGVHAALVLGDAAETAGHCGARAPADFCLDAAGVHELDAASLAATLSGELLLLVDGATLVVEGADGTVARHAAGARAGALPGQTETVRLLVRIVGASGALDAAGGARLFAPELRIETAQARFEDATGALDVGLRTYRAASDRVDAEGALVLLPAPVPAEGGFSAIQPIAYAPTFETEVLGDVQRINLRAVPVYEEAPAQAAGLAAVVAAAVAAIAYFWPHVQFHATSLVLPLYSRLQPPKLLDNDVRSGIYDIIRQNPGISARGIHRKSSQSWGTVVYHLRQLEAHHLVVSRRFGRARNYYENHGKYRGMEQQLACLRSPRARALAHAILSEPGVTQERLAEIAGLAQPTTSYYARKLSQAQLVTEAREGRYVRYLPTSELERYLRLAEQPDAAPATGAAPAQA